MNQKELRTSTKQRIVISLVAFLMLAATIATYVLIILNSKNGEVATVSEVNGTSKVDEAALSELETKFAAAQNEAVERAAELSDKYFDSFKSYKSRVRSFNAATANSQGLKTEDLKEGTGKVLTEGDLDYLAYYIGFCADESIFDSSFDNYDEPTALSTPISADIGLIEGWNAGVVGMKVGGVRELTVPGELAYGETQEICGGSNSPLKFIVMAIEDAKMSEINSALLDIQAQLIALYSGKAAE